MSTRKNLVVIIDRSGSMGGKNRLILAKNAALTVLDTLTPDDYVSICIAWCSEVYKHRAERIFLKFFFVNYFINYYSLRVYIDTCPTTLFKTLFHVFVLFLCDFIFVV